MERQKDDHLEKLGTDLQQSIDVLQQAMTSGDVTAVNQLRKQFIEARTAFHEAIIQKEIEEPIGKTQLPPSIAGIAKKDRRLFEKLLQADRVQQERRTEEIQKGKENEPKSKERQYRLPRKIVVPELIDTVTVRNAYQALYALHNMYIDRRSKKVSKDEIYGYVTTLIGLSIAAGRQPDGLANLHASDNEFTKITAEYCIRLNRNFGEELRALAEDREAGNTDRWSNLANRIGMSFWSDDQEAQFDRIVRQAKRGE